jgi:polyisoprenoid-binding protein YceI
VGFIARHLMVAKVRGKFTEFSGTVEVAEQLADSVANVTIKTASVDTGTADRDAHLRSADFFDSETYPEMTFVSTSFDGSTLVG